MDFPCGEDTKRQVCLQAWVSVRVTHDFKSGNISGKQEAPPVELGEDWNQKKVSMMESKPGIDQ